MFFFSWLANLCGPAPKAGSGEAILRAAALVCVPFVLSPASSAFAGTPERVVSLNLCADELLLQLAEPQQIAGLSWLVRDPSLSWHSDEAQQYPVVRGVAEEIIQLQPDLVLAGAYSTPATVALLERLRIPLLRLALPRSFDEIRRQIHQVAQSLGQVDRGRRMLADMETRLQKIADARPVEASSAALFQPNGQTATAGSLVHEVMRLAGLDNVAADWPRFAPLPLEILVLRNPQWLILSEHGEHPSLATEMATHPVLQGRHKTVRIPAQAWTCGTVNTLRAIEILHAHAGGGS